MDYRDPRMRRLSFSDMEHSTETSETRYDNYLQDLHNAQEPSSRFLSFSTQTDLSPSRTDGGDNVDSNAQIVDEELIEIPNTSRVIPLIHPLLIDHVWDTLFDKYSFDFIKECRLVCRPWYNFLTNRLMERQAYQKAVIKGQEELKLFLTLEPWQTPYDEFEFIGTLFKKSDIINFTEKYGDKITKLTLSTGSNKNEIFLQPDFGYSYISVYNVIEIFLMNLRNLEELCLKDMKIDTKKRAVLSEKMVESLVFVFDPDVVALIKKNNFVLERKEWMEILDAYSSALNKYRDLVQEKKQAQQAVGWWHKGILTGRRSGIKSLKIIKCCIESNRPPLPEESDEEPEKQTEKKKVVHRVGQRKPNKKPSKTKTQKKEIAQQVVEENVEKVVKPPGRKALQKLEEKTKLKRGNALWIENENFFVSFFRLFVDLEQIDVSFTSTSSDQQKEMNRYHLETISNEVIAGVSQMNNRYSLKTLKLSYVDVDILRKMQDIGLALVAFHVYCSYGIAPNEWQNFHQSQTSLKTLQIHHFVGNKKKSGLAIVDMLADPQVVLVDGVGWRSWKSLGIGDPFRVPHICHVIAQMGELVNLQLGNIPPTLPLFLRTEHARNFNLKSINIERGGSLKLIANLANFCPSLEELTVQINGKNFEEIDSLFEITHLDKLSVKISLPENRLDQFQSKFWGVNTEALKFAYEHELFIKGVEKRLLVPDPQKPSLSKLRSLQSLRLQFKIDGEIKRGTFDMGVYITLLLLTNLDSVQIINSQITDKTRRLIFRDTNIPVFQVKEMRRGYWLEKLCI